VKSVRIQDVQTLGILQMTQETQSSPRSRGTDRHELDRVVRGRRKGPQDGHLGRQQGRGGIDDPKFALVGLHKAENVHHACRRYRPVPGLLPPSQSGQCLHRILARRNMRGVTDGQATLRQAAARNSHVESRTREIPRDENQIGGGQSAACGRVDQAFLLQVVDPIGIRRDEEVTRRPRFNLFGQAGTGV
jgi:hypothetical protein